MFTSIVIPTLFLLMGLICIINPKGANGAVSKLFHTLGKFEGNDPSEEISIARPSLIRLVGATWILFGSLLLSKVLF